MENREITEDPTLRVLQDYMQKVTDDRGFSDETISELFMMFLEESGEFAKAARKMAGIKNDLNKPQTSNLDHEAADVFIYLLTLCNKLGIDLEKAFREKEAINNTRTWK